MVLQYLAFLAAVGFGSGGILLIVDSLAPALSYFRLALGIFMFLIGGAAFSYAMKPRRGGRG